MKKYSGILLALLLCLIVVLPVEAHPARLIDEADLLTADEEMMLGKELNEISDRQQFDVVVVTVNSLGNKSAEAFADDYFDYNGYGMGENRDGALLLISMGERQWHISTRGYGVDALHDSNLIEIEDEIVPYLSSEWYYDAFHSFAVLCDEMVTEARKADEPMNPIVALAGCVAIGFLLSFIPVGLMKAEMKSVHIRQEASDYIKSDRINITKSRDAFLYRNITRQKKPEPKSASSTTHRSSSGASHGGRGGSF